MNLRNDDTITVVMLVSSMPPLSTGGAEKQALRLSKKLIKKGINIFIVTPGVKGINKKTTEEGVKIIRLYSFISRLFERFSHFKKNNEKKVTKIEYDDSRDLVNEINRPVSWPTVIYYNIFLLHCLILLWPKRNHFDIIHCHTTEWPAIVAAKLGKALKKKVLIKDSTANGFKSLRRYPSGLKLQRLIIARSHFVAMTTTIYSNLLKEGVPEKKITAIPNGIELLEQSRNNEEAANNMKVLFVGNLYQQPAKGVDILLKAWALVYTKFPSAKLVVVGEGDIPAYQDFTKKLNINDVVSFEGKQNDISNYYSSSAVFVLPSRREGMSNALIEAMSWGIPCIATNISGNKDLIEHNKNGWLIPVADISALADSICYFLSNPSEAAAMGIKAKSTIRQKVDLDMVTDRYVNLYSSILNSSKN